MKMQNSVSAAQALQLVQSGHRLFVHGGAATPNTLIKALVERASELRDIELIHLHTIGPATYAKPEYAKSFKVANLFVGENVRGYLNYKNVDYLPCFLSEMPALFRQNIRRPKVALIHLSPPNAHGYCTLGTSLDAARAAVDTADILIAQINTQMPRVTGDTLVHINDLDAWVEVDEALPEQPRATPTEVESSIGRRVSELVEDGATLQTGIGNIPDAVMDSLGGHRNLGLHTEMWSVGMMKLIKQGVVNNSKKSVYRGHSVSTFLVGNREMYDFVNDNPSIVQLEASYVNDPAVIRRNPKVTAINSAVEIDLTGQICADSVGSHIISGVGGQMDFIRGATLSEGGKPIIAITSRSKKGIPKIVPTLKAGAGVVTTRAHVHWVVTEYGACNLAGMTLAERARALISLAHPEDRDSLDRAWRSHA
jgi:4-hydroxybutyrate CoA-transferase